MAITDTPLARNHDTMHLVGNFNGWSTSANPMTLVSDYTWQTTVDLTSGGSLKFVPVNWSLSYGDVNSDGVADSSGGGNIAAPESGAYVVTFNDNTRGYHFAPVQ